MHGIIRKSFHSLQSVTFMLSRLYLNDFDLNLLLVMGLLLPTDCFVFFLSWSISASSSSLRIYCWAFASRWCHRSASYFLASPFSEIFLKLSSFSQFHAELFFQTNTLLLSVLQSSFRLGQQSQGFDISYGTPLPFSVYPTDLFPSGVA